MLVAFFLLINSWYNFILTLSITDLPFTMRTASPSQFLCFLRDSLHHTTEKYLKHWAQSNSHTPESFHKSLLCESRYKLQLQISVKRKGIIKNFEFTQSPTLFPVAAHFLCLLGPNFHPWMLAFLLVSAQQTWMRTNQGLCNYLFHLKGNWLQRHLMTSY